MKTREKTILTLFLLFLFINLGLSQEGLGGWITVDNSATNLPTSYTIEDLGRLNYNCNSNAKFEYFAIFENGEYMSSRDQEFDSLAVSFSVDQKITHFYISSIYDDEPPPIGDAKLIASENIASAPQIPMVSQDAILFANQDIVLDDEITLAINIDSLNISDIKLQENKSNFSFKLKTSIKGFSVDSAILSPDINISQNGNGNRFGQQLNSLPNYLYFDLNAPSSNPNGDSIVTFELVYDSQVVASLTEKIGVAHDPNNIELINFVRNSNFDELYYKINFQNGAESDPSIRGEKTDSINVVIKKPDWWGVIEVDSIKIAGNEDEFEEFEIINTSDEFKILMKNCELSFCTNPTFPSSTGYIILKVIKTERFPSMFKKCNTVFGRNLGNPGNNTFVQIQFHSPGMAVNTYELTNVVDAFEIHPHKRRASNWWTRAGVDILCWLGFNNR